MYTVAYFSSNPSPNIPPAIVTTIKASSSTARTAFMAKSTSLHLSAQIKVLFISLLNPPYDCKIVIPDNAHLVEKTAAEELQNYIEKALSVKLPVVSEGEAEGAEITKEVDINGEKVVLSLVRTSK